MTFSIAPSIEAQSLFIEREIRWFPLKRIGVQLMEWAHQHYLKSLTGLLDEAYTDIQGALVVLKDYSSDEATRDLPIVRRALKLLIIYKSYLEETEYLRSTVVKEKIHSVISALYDAEIQLKRRAFDAKAIVPTETEVLDALASASKGALHRSLSH